jgi:hypothetical protein
VEAFDSETAKLTGTRRELCTWGEPTRTWCGWPKPQALRATPSALNTTGRDDCRSRRGPEGDRRPTMEDMLCAMALKSANDRQIQHTQAGFLVCCERALKSVGERTTHGGGGCRCGGLRETARAREVALSDTSGWRAEALHAIDGGWRRFGGGGSFSPCWRVAGRKYRLALRVASSQQHQKLKALRASRFLADLYIVYSPHPDIQYYNRGRGALVCSL